MAHALYDHVASMRESEELKFVPPTDADLASEKPPKALQLDASKTGFAGGGQDALHSGLDEDAQVGLVGVKRNTHEAARPIHH